MRLRSLLALLLASLSACALLSAQQTLTPSQVAEQTALHRSGDWDLIAPHLANPATASAAELELQGDVLKVRRFPEDALEYYQYAMKRGGNPAELMKKIGVVRLELQQAAMARAIFVNCTHMAKNDPQAWNNLAATDYILGSYGRAITEYKRAVKLDKRSAIFQANLGMAYLSAKQTDDARQHFQRALELDPHILEDRSHGGVTIRAFMVKDFSRLCMEMAHMYVATGQIQLAKVWLQRAGDHGTDLRAAMDDDDTLRPLLKDPEFVELINSTEAFRKRIAVTNVPTLGTGAEGHSVPE